MSAIELKSNFHKLIDSISNETLLAKFFEIMSNASTSKSQSLWDKLSLEEQQELLEIEKESRNESNLISNDDMKSKHNKWL
jgi:hypothetical protein